MSYAFVQDIAARWQDYQQVAAALVRPAPAGLILHAAGPTDEALRIILLGERNGLATVPDGAARSSDRLPERPARPEPTFRDLHPPTSSSASGYWDRSDPEAQDER